MVSTRIKEKTLVENAVFPPTETKKQVHLLIQSVPLPKLAQRRSVWSLFQTNFVNWQCKVFAQFYDDSEPKKISSYKVL